MKGEENDRERGEMRKGQKTPAREESDGRRWGT